MDSNIQKALWLGVGILFFVAVVSTGIFLFGKGKTLAESSGDQLDSMSKQLSEVEYSSYDNCEISGSDVLNAIKKYKASGGEMIIVVKTSYPSTTQYISSGTVNTTVLSTALSGKTKTLTDQDIKDAGTKTTTTYINPLGSFYSQLIYDSNDAVKGITVVQQ